jgi:8-oxo-dGTP diphosphatase
LQKPFHHLSRGIIIKENKILVAKANIYPNTFLPGGHIEFGESAKDALIREIEEELGIKCSVIHFLGLVEHRWEKKGILNYEINQVFEVMSNELHPHYNPKSRETHLEFFWCDVSDLEKENLQPYLFRDLINDYVKGNKNIWWESTLNSEIDDSNRN